MAFILRELKEMDTITICEEQFKKMNKNAEMKDSFYLEEGVFKNIYEHGIDREGKLIPFRFIRYIYFKFKRIKNSNGVYIEIYDYYRDSYQFMLKCSGYKDFSNSKNNYAEVKDNGFYTLSQVEADKVIQDGFIQLANICTQFSNMITQEKAKNYKLQILTNIKTVSLKSISSRNIKRNLIIRHNNVSFEYELSEGAYKKLREAKKKARRRI